MTEPITIRNLTLNDLDSVANIHLAAFSDSGLTRLGIEAVRRYYLWQMEGPHDLIAFGAFNQGSLVGFCVAGVFHGALGGFLDRNRGYLIRRVLMHPWMLLNPLFRERAQFAIRRLFKRFFPSPPHSLVVQNVSTPAASCGVLSIAVAPSYQGSRAATLLMQQTERAAVERGFTRMHLTVHPVNLRAIHFYKKHGWQREQTTGEWTGRMSKDLSSIDVRHDE